MLWACRPVQIPWIPRDSFVDPGLAGALRACALVTNRPLRGDVARILFAQLATLLLLLFGGGRLAWAQPRPDAGVPVVSDAGAPPPRADTLADGGAPQATSPDAGAAGPVPGVDAPVINIPQSEAEKAEGQPISRIDISGNRRVAKDDIVSYLREKPGNGFKVDNLASDVRALWDSGFFDDVEVDMTREDRGVILRFLVRERPNIKSIEFDGNSEIENDKLHEAIEVKANTILSVPAVRRSVQKIKDAYAEKGYFLADVDEHRRAAARQRGHRQVQDHRAPPVTVRRITLRRQLAASPTTISAR